MGYFQCVFLIVLLSSYVCGEINEDNEDSNVLEHIVWRQSTDVGELLADVKVIIMGQEQQIQQQQEFQQQLQQQLQEFQQQMIQQQQESQQQMIQQQQEFQQQMIQQQQESHQQMQQQQQEFPQQIRRETQPLREKLQQMQQKQQEFQQQLQQQQQEFPQQIRQETQPLKEKLQHMQQKQQEFHRQMQQGLIPHIHGCKTTERGREYAGTLAVTKTGKTCKRWDSMRWYSASQFPEATVAAAANYCRNPNNSSRGPECVITKSSGHSSWEYCDVPLCL